MTDMTPIRPAPMGVSTTIAHPRFRPACGLAAALLVGASMALEAATLVGPVVNPANQHGYYLLEADSWQDSERQAVELGGHLVTINDRAEQDWVFSTFGAYAGVNRSLWIGLREVNVEGSFEWSSGEVVDFANWLPGQPDNSPVTGGEGYVHLLNTGNEYGHPGGLWNDIASPNSAFPTFNPICGVVEVDAQPSPVLSIRLSPLEICWVSVADRFYRVESSADPVAGPWTALGTAILGDGSRLCVGDEGIAGSLPRFYRVVLLP
jgi:hypothetical protein